jgi:Tfp pilus assembly protein FimT
MLTFFSRRRFGSQRGYSLVDLLATTAVVATVGAVAIPEIKKAVDGQQLGIDVRNVEREMQIARLDAVKAQQPIRVRFNCPSADTYRRVELLGTINNPSSGDDASANAAIRCATTGKYRYPAQDQDPLTRPNNDGPIQRLNTNVHFLTVQTLEFWPNGTVHTDPSNTTTAPWPVISGTVTLWMNKGNTQKSIQVNGLGKIQIQ